MRPLILTVLLLTACAPTLDPVGGEGYYSAINTETVKVQATQVAAIPITQSYAQQEYDRHATETAQPAAQTSTAIAQEQAIATLDAAETQSARNAIAYQTSLTITMEALTRLQSDTQKRIAENNRAIAEETYRADAMQWVYLGCAAGVGLVIFGGAIITLYFLARGGQTLYQTFERQAWDKVELDQEVNARKFGLYITSGGYTTREAQVVTIAEKHVEKYSHEQIWRQELKKLVSQGVIAGQGGAKHPFSETTLSPFVIRPETGAIWVTGYRKLAGVLLDNKIWRGAGPRVAPEWGEGWSWDRFEREFDMTPLHSLPEGNPPDVKTPYWSLAEAA